MVNNKIPPLQPTDQLCRLLGLDINAAWDDILDAVRALQHKATTARRVELNEFYNWCIDQSASPDDKYQVAWTCVERWKEALYTAVNSEYEAVNRFSEVMLNKLVLTAGKGRSGWNDPKRCDNEHLATCLVRELGKANDSTWVDIANYAMFLHSRGADPKLLQDALHRKSGSALPKLHGMYYTAAVPVHDINNGALRGYRIAVHGYLPIQPGEDMAYTNARYVIADLSADGMNHG